MGRVHASKGSVNSIIVFLFLKNEGDFGQYSQHSPLIFLNCDFFASDRFLFFLVVHSRSRKSAPHTHMLRKRPARMTAAPRQPPYSSTRRCVRGAKTKVPTPVNVVSQ